MEIERKFTVKQLPKNLSAYECNVLEQGYLCTNPIVRIRKSNEEYILTYKSKFGIAKEQEDINMANEVELPLTKESYEHLKTKVDHNVIVKRRYLIPIESNLTIELDVFEGYLQGLVFAEVEFPDEETARRFQPPEWLAEDVSTDIRYKNYYLSQVNSYEELRLEAEDK